MADIVDGAAIRRPGQLIDDEGHLERRGADGAELRERHQQARVHVIVAREPDAERGLRARHVHDPAAGIDRVGQRIPIR